MSGDVTYVLADVIIFVYEVPCVFWHYINVDEVSLITLKKVLQIATAWFITKCDGQLSQIATAFLLQTATRFITSCDRYYKVRWIYYKLRQVLQSAMIITNCDSTIDLLFFAIKCDSGSPTNTSKVLADDFQEVELQAKFSITWLSSSGFQLIIRCPGKFFGNKFFLCR